MWVTSWTEIITSWPFFQKILILRRPEGAIFAGIIKILTTFIKTILKDSRKVRRIRSYVSKWNLYLDFSIQNICWFPVKKCWCQQNSRGVPRDLYNTNKRKWMFTNLKLLEWLKTWNKLQKEVRQKRFSEILRLT